MRNLSSTFRKWKAGKKIYSFEKAKMVLRMLAPLTAYRFPFIPGRGNPPFGTSKLWLGCNNIPTVFSMKWQIHKSCSQTRGISKGKIWVLLFDGGNRENIGW